jgi:hypothetical protein
MSRLLAASLFAVVLVLAVAMPSDAWRSSVSVYVGPGWWGPPYPYWWYSPPYYVYTPPPVIIRQQPTVYIEQEPAPTSPPPPPTATQAPQGFWYYCASAKGYYPTVPTCQEDWIKVSPRP